MVTATYDTTSVSRPSTTSVSRLKQEANELKAKIDLREFYEADFDTAKRSGNWVTDSVLWREDNKRSLSVSQYRWYDEAMGDSGDIFDLVRRVYEGVDTFRQAVEYVRDWYNSHQPAAPKPIIHRQEPMARHEPPSEAWQKAAMTEVERCERYLWSDAPDAQLVWNYLHTVRGLSDEAIRLAQLGFNPSWTKTRCQTMDDRGVVKNASLAPGITIPWLVDGVLWAVRIRRIVDMLADALHQQEEQSPKYSSLTGSRPHSALYQVRSVQTENPLLFVEGEFDAMLGQQLVGDLAAVVTCGSASGGVPDRWREQIEQASVILLALDNDDAGQKGTKDLLETLGDKAHVIRYPAGKDLTEYVVDCQGDLRAWLTDELVALSPLPSVSDGIRAAALNCKLDAAIVVYELLIRAGYKAGQIFTKPALKEANRRLGLNINERQIDRGVDQGVGVFSTRSDPSSSDSPTDFVENGKASGRKPDNYILLAADAIIVNLRVRLPSRLIEKHFSLQGKSPILPVLALDQQILLNSGLTEDSASILLNLLQQVGDAQNAEVRQRFKAYTTALDELQRALSSSYSTPLEAGWGERNQYAPNLLRGIHEIDDRPRKNSEMATITGRRANNLKGVLQRAGMENQPRPPAIIPIISEKDIRGQVFDAARGKGKAFALVATKDGQEVASTHFDPAEAQAWGEAQMADGAEVAVKVFQSGEQRIVGPICPTPPRQRRQTETRKPVSPSPTVHHEPYTDPGLSPLYLRTLAQVALWRAGKLGKPHTVAMEGLSVQAVTDFLRRYILTGKQVIDTTTGEIVVRKLTSDQLLSLLTEQSTMPEAGDEFLLWVQQAGWLVEKVEPTLAL